MIYPICKFTGAKKGIVVKEVDGKITNENVSEEPEVKDSTDIKFVNRVYQIILNKSLPS